MFPINSTESCSQRGSSARVLAKRLVSARVGRQCLSCSTFPHRLAPNLLPSRASAQFSSLRAHSISPLSTWLPAILLGRPLSPPMWSWARKSIKLLITVGSRGCVQVLRQQLRAPEPVLAGRPGRAAQHTRPPAGPCSAPAPRRRPARLLGLAALAPRDGPLSPAAAGRTSPLLPLRQAVKILSSVLLVLSHVFPQRRLGLPYGNQMR